MLNVFKYILVIILVSSATILFSQNNAGAKSDKLLVDSLREVIAGAKNDTIKAIAYHIISETLLLSEPDSARKVCEIAIAICKKNLDNPAKLNQEEKDSYTKTLGASISNIGTSYYLTGNAPAAIDNFVKAIKHLGSFPASQNLASIYNNLAACYSDIGEMNKELETAYKALKMYESVGDKKGIARCYNNIGMAYREQKDIAKAVEFLDKSLKLRIETGDKRGLSSTLYNLALCHGELKDTTKVKEYLKQGLAVTEETGNKNSTAYILTALGHFYFDKNDFKNALEYFTKALKLREEINDKKGISFSYQKIANVYYKSGNNTLAKQYADKALVLAKEMGFPENIRGCASLLSDIYQKEGNVGKAFDMYKLFIKMRDSLDNESTRKASVKKVFQMQYESKSAQDSISNAAKFKEDQLKHEQAITRQRIYTYGGLAGFVLMLVVAGVSFRAFKSKQKANVIITEQKHLAETQKHIIEEKQKEILDSIHYAKRIQGALLPSEKYFEKNITRMRNPEK